MPSLADFTDETFNNYERRFQALYMVNPLLLYDLAKQGIQQFKAGRAESVEILLRDISTEDRKALLEKVYLRGAKEVEEKHFTEGLKDTFSHSRLKWRKDFATQITKRMINLPSREPYGSVMMIAGKTQSGKSSVKSIIIAQGYDAGIPTVVVTKGITEAREVTGKFQKAARPDLADLMVCSSGNPGQTWKSRKEKVFRTFQNGGALVVADTASQIARAIEVVETTNRNFNLVVDECDAMYRTKEKTQKMEVQLDKLREIGPKLTVMISATPVPAMLALHYEEDKKVDLVLLDTDEDYIGVEQMVRTFPPFHSVASRLSHIPNDFLLD